MVSVPVLVIGNTADDACTPSHTTRIYESVAHADKERHDIVGATHYYGGDDGRAHLAEAVTTTSDFIDRRGGGGAT